MSGPRSLGADVQPDDDSAVQDWERTTMPKPPGLYAKFRVSKFDRSRRTYREFREPCFVLVPSRDPAAVEALRAYAVAVAHTKPHLAWDLVGMCPDLQASVVATGCPMPDQLKRVANQVGTECPCPEAYDHHESGCRFGKVAKVGPDMSEERAMFAALRAAKEDGSVSDV